LPALAKCVGVLGYQPFASGAFFSSDEEPYFSYRARVGRIAEQRKLTPPQILVQYVFQQPGISAVVVGTVNPDHLDEIIRAIDSERSVEHRLEI
jgi:aryl-alcohol dehydrogenase-like predicted oxidoreductase